MVQNRAPYFLKLIHISQHIEKHMVRLSGWVPVTFLQELQVDFPLILLSRIDIHILYILPASRAATRARLTSHATMR